MLKAPVRLAIWVLIVFKKRLLAIVQLVPVSKLIPSREFNWVSLIEITGQLVTVSVNVRV